MLCCDGEALGAGRAFMGPFMGSLMFINVFNHGFIHVFIHVGELELWGER